MAQQRPFDETFTSKYLRIANDLIAEIEGEIWTMIKQSDRKAFKRDVYNIILREGAAAFLQRKRKPASSDAPPPESARGPDIGRAGDPEYPHIPVSGVVKAFKLFDGIHLPDNGMLRYAADTSGLMVWMSDANGKNVYASPLLQWYTGCGAEDFRQDGWINRVHPEDQRKTVDRYAEYLLRRIMVRFDYRFWRADRHWGYIVDLAQPRFYPDGSFAGFVGTMHEVSTEIAVAA